MGLPSVTTKNKQSRNTRFTASASSTHRSTALIFGSLCVAIALETLFFWPSFGNGYTVPKVVAALIGGALLLPQVCLLLFRNTYSPSLYRLIALFGFQILAMTWATTNSISPAVSFWGGDWRRMGWITQFAMMVVALGVPLAIGSNFSKWKHLLRFIAAIGFISAAYGLLQWLGWDPFLPESLRGEIVEQFGGRYRSAGTIGQPNYFADYLIYPFFSSLALLLCEGSLGVRLLAGGTMALTGATLVFAAASRAGLLGCAIGFTTFAVWFVLFWLRPAERAFPSKVACIALGIFAALMTIAAPRVQPGRFANFGTDSQSIGRIILWRDVLDRILPNVWVHGTGPGMFRVAFARYRSPSYSLFGPDVHWETPHDVFLDRFSEQGIAGVLAFLAMIVVFSVNIVHAMRSTSDWKRTAAYAAIGSGMVAVLVDQIFNGEVIPTTFYFYLWVGLSVAVRDCAPLMTEPVRNPRRGPKSLRIAVVAVALLISFSMLWHAERNWRAEALLRTGMRASDSGDAEKLLVAAEESKHVMPQVGTYHLDFAGVISDFLFENRNSTNDSTRRALAQTGIDSALWAVERTDEPMVALLHLISLGDMISDARTVKWLDQLKEIDPYWFRPHELSSRSLLRQGKIDEALKEVTLARQLAPYVQSTTNLWNQLNTVRREFGSVLK